MPKTNFKPFDKQAFIAIADRLESFAQRYRDMAESVADGSVELPNQKTFEKGLSFIRTHAGRAQMKVDKHVDERQHMALAKPIAKSIEAKKKKPKQPKQ